MNITRTSPLTGQVATMDLPVTQEQLDEFARHDRRLVQQIFPNLTPDQREFIKTGYTADDWALMFPEEDQS